MPLMFPSATERRPKLRVYTRKSWPRRFRLRRCSKNHARIVNFALSTGPKSRSNSAFTESKYLRYLNALSATLAADPIVPVAGIGRTEVSRMRRATSIIISKHPVLPSAQTSIRLSSIVVHLKRNVPTTSMANLTPIPLGTRVAGSYQRPHPSDPQSDTSLSRSREWRKLVGPARFPAL